jgi:hypothetical protein
MAEQGDLQKISENITLEEAQKKRLADILGKIDEILDPLQKKVEEYSDSLSNLINIEIIGKDDNEKLKNFKESAEIYLKGAKEIEGENESSGNSFKKYKKLEQELQGLESDTFLDMKLRKKAERRKNEAESGFKIFDMRLEQSLRAVKKKLIESEKFKGETFLIFYLFSELEDIFMTPKITHDLLSKTEEEIKNLTLEEAEKQHKELDELSAQFEKIFSYFKNNIERLKKENFNESIVNEYIRKAFLRLKGIGEKDLKERAFKALELMDNNFWTLFKKIKDKKLEAKDAPHYSNLKKIAENIYNIYEKINSSSNVSESKELASILGKNLADKISAWKTEIQSIDILLAKKGEKFAAMQSDLGKFYASLSGFYDLIAALGKYLYAIKGGEMQKLAENKAALNEKLSSELFSHLAIIMAKNEKHNLLAKMIAKGLSAEIEKKLETNTEQFSAKIIMLTELFKEMLEGLKAIRESGSKNNSSLILGNVEKYNEMINLLKERFGKESAEIINNYNDLAVMREGQAFGNYLALYEDGARNNEIEDSIKKIQAKQDSLKNLSKEFQASLKSLAVSGVNINAISKDIFKDKLINELEGLKKMDNYANKQFNYEEAHKKLKSAVETWKSVTDFKILDKNAAKEERAKELETIAKVLKDLNDFNLIFFKLINEYTDFEKRFDKGEKIENLSGILANEISKVRYYEDVLNILQKINDAKTKATQARLKILLQGKSGKISELNKYKKFIVEKTKKEYLVYNKNEILKITDFDDKKNFKIINEALESIGEYFITMKEIGKIVGEFRIK